MISKYFFTVFAVAVLAASAAVTASAQVGELRGHVFISRKVFKRARDIQGALAMLHDSDLI